MQPVQPRCGLCGAGLGGASDELSLREIAGLASTLVLMLGGFVLVSAGLVWLVIWLLG